MPISVVVQTKVGATRVAMRRRLFTMAAKKGRKTVLAI
jgi:hypothetical protein